MGIHEFNRDWPLMGEQSMNEYVIVKINCENLDKTSLKSLYSRRIIEEINLFEKSFEKSFEYMHHLREVRQGSISFTVNGCFCLTITPY